MYQEFETFIAHNVEEHNLISKEDVDRIKIKLGKSHRKESDWAVIKDILLSHNVIVAEPAKPDRRVPVKKHILYEDGFLVVFTNIEDCNEHMIHLNREDGTPDRLFRLGSMPFEEAVGISEEYGMDLYIDLQAKANTMCMRYVAGEEKIEAVMIARE